MNDPRDFLPEKYRCYLDDVEKVTQDVTETKPGFTFPKKKKSKNRLVGLFIVFFLVIGVFSSYILSQQNQDNRQQASTGEPYPSISTSPDQDNRPTSSETCKGAGVWIGEKCYVYWEVLPGGTHMVVPGEYNSYGYEALIPIDKARLIQASLNDPSFSVTPTPSVSAYPQDPSDNSDTGCGPEFKMMNNICVPDQKSEYWNSEWVNKHGCGAMQALYYAMKSDPNIDPEEFLKKYYPSYVNGVNSGNTYDSENISVLEDLGYTVEPYTKSLIASGYKETDKQNSFLVKGVFSGGVNHYFSVDNIYTDEYGRTVFNTVDSYYNIDKCIASTGNTMNCYDADNKQVTSIDLSSPETSTYLVL